MRRPLFLVDLLSYSVLFFLVICPTNGDDASVLLEFKRNVGDPNGRLQTWLPTVSICSWAYVQCFGAYVYALTLNEAGFTRGIIPSSFGTLQYVQTLQLGGNNLTGNIPESLGNLGYLTDLQLYSNKLTGTIPSSLGNMILLQTLDLGGNKLTGDIPSSLGNLPSLQYLHLYDNQLTGVIPPSLANLANLQVLEVAYNKLTGEIPENFGYLTELTALNFWKNQLTGSIPQSFANLVSLQYLWIDENYLSGPVPFCLPGYQGTSPSGRPYSTWQLNCLDLSSTPSCNEKLKQRPAKECAPFCNAYQKQGSCGGVGNCTLLSSGKRQCTCRAGYRTFADNPFTCTNKAGPPVTPSVKIAAADVAALLDFKKAITSDPSGALKSWSTTNNCAKWTGLKCNAQGQVAAIDLSGKNLGGTISSSLGNLKKLASLNLGANQLTGGIPATLKNLAELQSLYLSSNQLTGSIPGSLGDLTKLVSFDVSSNTLTGNFLVEFDSQSLSTVFLNDNFLSGSAVVTNRGAIFCPKSGRKINFAKNCFNFTQAPACYSPTAQRPNVACNAFCRAQQFQGSCGGHGDCSENSNGDLTCRCAEGYNNKGDRFTCVFSVPSTGLSAFPAVQNPKFLNRHFRYGSTGYLRNKLERATWLVALSWSWRDEFSDWPVQAQGSCNACWAFAPVGALESAYAITHASVAPPRLSAQQLIDCPGIDTCAGGWPGDALEYAAQQSLQTVKEYPYKGRDKSRTCPSSSKEVAFRLSMYEEVESFGWAGLLLAVQQQPVIVSVEASTPEFINYKGGIFSSNDCYSNGVDHTVLLVGYDLSSSPQHWVIRNSWGPSWGEGGYMRLAITGGVGTCGINALPGIYPVFTKASDPCNLQNYGQTRLGNKAGPGTVNPCGDGTCSPKGSSYKCKCSAPFVVATNIDKSQTCIPAAPCAYFSSNPCGVGTCVDAPQSGEYSCLCPIGYAQGSFSSDGKPACVLGSTVSGVQFYTVPAGVSLSCSTLIGSYNIPSANFIHQNKGLKCGRPLPAGTRVNVTTNVAASGCSLPYTISAKDTCLSVANLFGIKSLAILNPGLDCTALFSGQQVCIVKGTPLPPPLCTQPYLLAPGESCASVIKKFFHGDAKSFYSLNPGIYCDRIFSGAASAQQVPLIEVCLGSTNLGAINKACTGAKKVAKITAGQRCLQLYRKYFNGKRKDFARYNKNFQCRDAALRVGMTICIPK